MQRKGQAAMEFLMTYGWAILAAIIAIGVLAYFGVFSPGRFVAGAATINAPFGINAHNILASSTANDGTINFDMIQNSGQTLNGVTIIVTGTGASSAVTCTVAAFDGWLSGAPQNVALDCTDGTATDLMVAGGSFSGNIAVSYTAGSSILVQQTTGSVRNNIQ